MQNHLCASHYVSKPLTVCLCAQHFVVFILPFMLNQPEIEIYLFKVYPQKFENCLIHKFQLLIYSIDHNLFS